MNIILFTQVYPDEPGRKTLRSSAVCHYWTKEWVKIGHRVLVIYCYPNYNFMFHIAASLFPNFISQYTNGTITCYTTKLVTYDLDGVSVLKIPMRKFMPKIRYPEFIIERIVEYTCDYLSKIDFKADIILSHFDNPILEIAGIMKDKLNIPFSFVLHGYPSDIRRLYPKTYIQLINKVDVWGFRSKSIREDFELQYGKRGQSFIAYSGVPETYINNLTKGKRKIVGKVCYVGSLIKRKYPEKVLEAMIKWLRNGNMSLTYIGEGALDKTIKKIVKKNKIEDYVQILGNIDRNEVQKELDTADIFIMISRHETFGMVYLEAMAHGCITIASRKEGFDGIIEDGVNGFLCESGNSNELSAILDQILRMSESEIDLIRSNAIETARRMTESEMAKLYLNDVENILLQKR
jgi:glycosyltransferase involved in cell wall biosynthesis